MVVASPMTREMMKTKPKLTGRSRCGRNGKMLGFACCGALRLVGHLSWSALICPSCDQVVEKHDIVDMGNIK
jgi:hypothetical protein